MTTFRLPRWAFCVGLFAAIAPGVAFANLYSVDLLSAPGAISSAAFSISNNGYVAGSVLLNNWNGPAYSGVVWGRDTNPRMGLGLDATAVNSSGTVTGSSKFEFWQRAATSSVTDFAYLDLLGAGHESKGNAINERGQVAGYSTILAGGTPHAVRWDGTTATDLGTLGGAFSYAFGINESGAIVGGSRPYANACCDDHATLWNPDGTMVDLGLLLVGSGDSVARGINDNSDAVGYARYGLSNYQAVLWHQGTATALGTLAGEILSAAYDINNSGLIVGVSNVGGSSRATLWQNGLAFDLNEFLPPDLLAAGWELNSALSINDDGSIVGNAVNYGLHRESAFLLRAAEVPEPSTVILLFVGMLNLYACRRRYSRSS
jgi:probable HAF family extracellular repeat protein